MIANMQMGFRSEYFTAKDYNTGRIIVGLISPLQIF